MSTFAGIVTLDGSPVDRRAEDCASRAITALRKGRTLTRRLADATFVQRALSMPGGGHGEAQPFASPDGRVLFAAIARLDNRDDLGAALGLAPAELARASDTMLLRRMHERWGEAGVARCVGAFAFALWDADARRLTLGRDCLGNRALFFHRGAQFVAFATTLGALLALPGVPRAIDEIGIANFLVLNNREQRRTFYDGIERVPSRTLVTIDCNRIRHRYYWAPDLDAPPPYSREEDYIERARELLDVAVAAATSDTPRVAISTSGGFDSSALAATAARLGRAESITCFSVVPPPGTSIDVGPFKYFDEREKVEALGHMHPALDIRFIAPDRVHPVIADDTRFFTRANLPTHGPAALDFGIHLVDAVTRSGHDSMLIGNYGNFGLTWSGSCSLLALLQARKWGAFAREWRAVARESGRSTARTFAGEVLAPIAPVWMRRLVNRLRGRDPDSVAHFSTLNPAFILECGLARQWRTQGFDPWYGQPDWNAARWRALRVFDLNQYARDVRGMADEIFGFEIRDPHADRRLLEFTLAVPEPMFRRDGIPRSFARKVLADRLPREILDERRRGASAPTWFRTLDTRRQDLARDIEDLEASPLARRLLDIPRLKHLMAQWPKDKYEAENRRPEYRSALARGVHIGRFVRWVEGGNA
jgi:asparagine synthase (glutamine-hydrolysing)